MNFKLIDVSGNVPCRVLMDLPSEMHEFVTKVQTTQKPSLHIILASLRRCLGSNFFYLVFSFVRQILNRRTSERER